MDGSTMMNRLAELIDAHAWDELSDLLHEDFECNYVHTGESFDRGTWVRLNADYPGFERFVLQDCIGSTARAAGRSHVTGRIGDTLQHFEVATFISLRAGRISEMTEVWTNVNEQTPQEKRPA